MVVLTVVGLLLLLVGVTVWQGWAATTATVGLLMVTVGLFGEVGGDG